MYLNEMPLRILKSSKAQQIVRKVTIFRVSLIIKYSRKLHKNLQDTLNTISFDTLK